MHKHTLLAAGLLVLPALMWSCGGDDDDGGSGGTADLGGLSDAGSDMGMEADMGMDTDMSMAPDMEMMAPDMGADAPRCPPNSNYGLLEFPGQAGDSDSVASSPRAAWSGSSWGVVWSRDVEGEDLNELRFGRFGEDGAAMGEATTLGRIRTPTYDIVSTGSAGGFAVVWIARRTDADNFEGVRYQLFDNSGMAIGPASSISPTFDTEQVSLAWGEGVGGMLAYTRGRQGSDGLFVLPLNTDGTGGDLVQATENPARSPAVAFNEGTGGFGLSWITPAAGEEPPRLTFSLLNDQGEANDDEPFMLNDGGAQGQLHIAYGNGVFAIGWSQLTPDNMLVAKVTLLDEGGDLLASPPIQGPMGFGLITDMTWLGSMFAVAWQDSPPGGAPGRVGVTRLDTNGIALEPYPLEVGTDGQAEGLAIAGPLPRLGAFFTFDPSPRPDGLSDEARVWFGPVGVCRM